MQDPAIGNNIRRLREERGLKQQVLAVHADIAVRTLARIEGGEDCNVRTLIKIADILEVPLADLVADAEPVQASA